MRRRNGFTLVELLVAMALIVFILMLLAETFAKALDTFRDLKAIGDMDERLRSAVTILRRDLSADHFEGKRRPSDRDFWGSDYYQGPPREGFLRILKEYDGGNNQAVPVSQTEGFDSYQWTSRRLVKDALHFSVKLRGNHIKDFFTAMGPGASLLGLGQNDKATFMGQSTHPDNLRQNNPQINPTADARYQQSQYSCQWAEVAYFMVPTGKTTGTSTNIPLFALYRSQFAVPADNSALNWPPLNASATQFYDVSCQPGATGTYFNNPNDLAKPVDGPSGTPKFYNRAFYGRLKQIGGLANFNPSNAQTLGATLLLSDVLSFEVMVLRKVRNDWIGNGKGQDVWTENEFVDGVGGIRGADGSSIPINYDPLMSGVARAWDSAVQPQNDPDKNSTWAPAGVQIRIRVWDLKSQKARQTTLMQNL